MLNDLVVSILRVLHVQVLYPGIIHFVPQLDPNLCMTRHCLRAADMYRSSMNLAMHPCDNFYEYACANYPNLHDIPRYLDHYDPFLMREENINKILLGYIKNINLLWPKGFQKVRKYYELCINEDQRRQVGYDTLKEELAIIGMKLEPQFHLKIEPRKDFSAILARIHRYSTRAWKFLHSVSVESFSLKMELNTLIIGSVIEPQANESEGNVDERRIPPGDEQPEQRLPPADERPERRIPPEDELLVQSRERYMISVVTHLYSHCKIKLTEDMKKEIEQRVNDVLDLESELNQVSRSLKAEKISQTSQQWRPSQMKAQLEEILSGGEIQIDFNEYLETLYAGCSSPVAPPLKEILATPDYNLMITIDSIEEVTKIYEILRKTSSAVFESYMWWTIVESLIEEGPAPLFEYSKGYQAERRGMAVRPLPIFPRDHRCMVEVRKYFGKFVGYALARQTNGQGKKKKVTEMLENIRLSYQESIQRTPWADEDTKNATLKKIQNMTAFIGFNDSILESKTIDEEYKKVDIQPGNYYKSLAGLQRQVRQEELFQLFTINDFNQKPECNPADPLGAHYIRAYNHIVTPITLMQFPFYDLGLEVLHHATLGYTLAHEMGHAIDVTGSQYDAEGNMRYIMSDHTNEEYNKIFDCFVKAYSNLYVYIPPEGKFLPVNGLASVDENMADWQGFNMAMMAYKKYVEKHGPEPSLPGIFSEMNHMQLFSLVASNQYCVHPTTSYLVRTALSCMHAPERARVNGVLKNSRQFADAFGCSADAPMNPPTKCEIWF